MGPSLGRRESRYADVWRCVSSRPPGDTGEHRLFFKKNNKILFTSKKNMLGNVLYWGSFITNNQTADGLRAATMTTRHGSLNESPRSRLSSDAERQSDKGRGRGGGGIGIRPSALRTSTPLCELTAEAWSESVRGDSEGRQTATEPSEPAREPLGPSPPPSRTVTLVNATWSKLCDRRKEGKQEREK